MEAQNIGILISKLRKNKNLTQQELANQLGVSPKTISKWETGNGLPDISMLKKISKTFDITIEELLEGNTITKEKKKHKRGMYIILLIIFIILIVLLIFIFNKQKINSDDKYNCTMIKTYYINNINKSNDENYLYITISEYQIEGTYTVKLPIVMSKHLKVGDSYEFTLKTNKDYISTTTDILFENTEIIKIEYTDKIGLDRVNTYNCE